MTTRSFLRRSFHKTWTAIRIRVLPACAIR